MKPLSERDENRYLILVADELNNFSVGMKPLSERDENRTLKPKNLLFFTTSRNEATL